MPERRLRIVQWQVAQQERLINDQRALISRLRAGGLPTEEAERFLKQMYDVLAFRRRALDGSRELSCRRTETR